MSGEGKQPAALGPGLAPFLDSTRIGAGLPPQRHLAVVGDDLPVSAAGLCLQRIAPDGGTRLQKVGSLRCAFLASPLVHGLPAGRCAAITTNLLLPTQIRYCPRRTPKAGFRNEIPGLGVPAI